MDGEKRARFHWHMEANFRTPPPLPEVIDLVEEAIERCEAGEDNAVVATWPNGEEIRAGQIVEDFHCGFFVDAWQEES